MERKEIVAELVDFIANDESVKEKIEACLRAQQVGRSTKEIEDLLCFKLRMIISREIAFLIRHKESGCVLGLNHNSYCEFPVSLQQSEVEK